MPDQADLDAINDAIVDNATNGVRSTRFGNRQVDKLTPEEQAAGAAIVAGTIASGTSKFGLRFTTLIPPGCG